MKQRITDKQLNELSNPEKIKLIGWCTTKPFFNEFGFVYLTIGQLIWFLNDHIEKYDGWWAINKSRYPNVWTIESKYDVGFGEEDRPELVDCLWEAVKSALKEEEVEDAQTSFPLA